MKVISSLLMSLSRRLEYRVVFMLRPLAEVAASHAEMIGRRGTTGVQLPPEALIAVLDAHLKQVDAWLSTRPEIQVRRVEYHRVLSEARAVSEEVGRFLGLALNIEAARQVDLSFHHQRA